jgi:tetratricopeptide (TPR) repeat protein
MGLNWKNIFEALMPYLIVAVLTGIAGLIYDQWSKICIWARRQKLKFLPVDFNVAFSLDFKEGLNSGNYFEQIKKDFINLLNDTGLEREIKIRDFSDIKKFANREEAEKFRGKKNIDLIIWGGFSNDALKADGQNISEMDLNFTYGHPDDEQKKIGAMILLDISSKLAIKNYWKIIENNSLKDIKIVSNNLFDISTYILALTLKISGRIEKSLDLFEKLYNKLEQKNDEFRNVITPHLLNCYHLLAINAGVNKKDYLVGKTFCDKMLIFSENDFFAIANLALFQYKLGNEMEAEQKVELLLKCYPKDPLTEINVAFFRILRKNYSNAFKHYKNFLKFQSIHFNPQEVVEFLDEQYKIKKDPALLFGSGIVSMRFGDKKLAKKDLERFLKKSSEGICKPMYRMAKKLVAEFKNTQT